MSDRSEPTVVCAVCRRGWHHCHGVVIEHADGSLECSVACEGGPDMHDAVLSCEDVLRTCGCA